LKRDPIPGAEYSEFDRLKLERLPNWGRWGRHDPDRPDADRLGSPLVDRMKQDENDRDENAAPEDLPTPIDHADAERLDEWIKLLPGEHKLVIRRHFYLRRDAYWVDLDAACRRLMDLMDTGRVWVTVRR
jgi:hypothetical protein